MPGVILIAATSVDGRITRGAMEGNAFTSPEDRIWFQKTLAGMDAVLMGRKTYEAIAPALQARKDQTETPRIIFTHSPEQFAGDTGPGLQFTAESPETCIERLSTTGYTRLALVGGAALHTAFLGAGLVDELWLTIEPYLFGQGKLLAPHVPEVALELIEHSLLSTQTILLRYRVKRSSV